MSEAAPTTEAPAGQASKTLAGGLLAEIVNRREAHLQTQITNRPRRNTWASSIPVCTRRGVYEIAAWDQKVLHDTKLQARFNKGKQEEHALIRELGDLGFEVVEQQVSLTPDMSAKYRLSGNIDGKIKWGGRRIPFEIKSAKPTSYDRVNSLDDIRGDKWMGGYYRQLQAYLMGHNEEEGLLIITDCLGHWKMFVVPLDYDAAEAVLKTVEEINRHVDAGTLPDRIAYVEGYCKGCAFAHVCLPDVLNAAKAQFKDDPEMEKKLARRAELDMARREWSGLDDELKETLRGVELAVIGPFTVSGKPTRRTVYEYPDEIKKQYAKKAEGWKIEIEDTRVKEEE